MIQGTRSTAAEPGLSRPIELGEVRAADKGEFSSRSQLSTLNSQPLTTCSVALLTGGGDKPYALGLAAALTSEGILLDFIGSDDLSVPELLRNPPSEFS